MKAQATRAGGQHMARERGAYEEPDIFAHARVIGKDNPFVLFCRLSPASMANLTKAAKGFGLEIKP